MNWNSSPLRLNHRAEISSTSALAQWTEHRKACAETAPRFFCAAVAACFIVQRPGLSRAGSARWPNVRFWEVAGSRSHSWPILAGSRELGSNPLDKKRAFLRGDRFGVSIRGDSSRIVGKPGLRPESCWNDCPTRRKSIRPCVPSHVAYEVGAARQQTVRSPRTMDPHS